MTTISDLQRMGANQLVQGFEATVAKAWPAETKEGNFGPFVTQNVILHDSTGAEIRCRVMDPPAGGLNDREVVRISAFQDPKTKGWKGAVTTSYQGNLQLDVKGKAVQVLQAQPAATAPGTAPAPSRANGAYPRALEMPGDPPEQRRPQAPVQRVQEAFQRPAPLSVMGGEMTAHAPQAMSEADARAFFTRNMEKLLLHYGYLAPNPNPWDRASEELQVGLEVAPPHVLTWLGAIATSMFIATKPSRDGVHVQIEGRES